MVAKPEVVASPPVTPLPHGLYSVALVTDSADPHEGLAGFTYEPVSCGSVELTVAACVAPPSPGTVEISVDAAGLATVTADGVPAGDYVIDWGDGSEPETVDAAALNGTTHQYAAPGDYDVTITGPASAPIGTWLASGTVTVADAAASGPFDLTVATSKIADEGIEWVESGAPTPHYALVRCAPFGGVDLRARVQAAIDLNEQRAIEAGFIADVAQTAVDITPAGGAVSPDKGAALLQQYAGSNYGGVPVLHADRAVSHLLDNVDRVSNHLETTIGAWLAAGAGYAGAVGPLADPEDPDSGVAAGANEAWMFVTGQIVVRRGTVDLLESPIEVRSATAVANTLTALAERTTAVSHECFAAAILVTVTDAPAVGD